MKKRKLKVTVTTNNSKEEYSILGIYDEENKKIEYLENRDLVTNVILDYQHKTLKRDNKDYYLEYQLLEDKVTENKIEIKELDQSMILKIKTEKFRIESNKIEIVYTILDSDETIDYIIKF